MSEKQGENIFRRSGIIIPGICILVVLISAASAQVPQGKAANSGPTTWTVLVGGEAALGPQEYGQSGAWQFMRFYPENITINEGDRIEWKLKSSEPHTVTFLGTGKQMPNLLIPENNSSQRLLFNPLVILPQGGRIYNGTMLTGSGQLDIETGFPREYNLTFTKTGKFEYFCAFHGMMKANVTVQPAGTPYPRTPEQIDADATRLLVSDMEAALQGVPKAENVSSHPGKNGTTVYEVKIGYGNGRIDWMRFAPTNLTIHAGDSIVWTRDSAETPHTVSFLSGSKEPELVIAEPQQRGPPKLVVNPDVLMPAGGKIYNGTGYFNSGIIWGTTIPLPGPRGYNLTFNKPGTYEYICMLHDYMGMKGWINVLPK